MTAREEAYGRFWTTMKPLVGDTPAGKIWCEYVIDSIIDAAREGMVGEDRVRELIVHHQQSAEFHNGVSLTETRVKELIESHDESLLAHLPAFTEREKLDKEFVEQRFSAHRNEEHLSDGDLRRNAAPLPEHDPESQPEHFDGEPCNLPVYSALCDIAKGFRFEFTGEYRPPKEKEWYMTVEKDLILLSQSSSGSNRWWILRPVPIASNSERVFISAEQAEAVIQALQDEYGGYNDKYTARDARAVYSLVDPDVESSKPSPAPWMPKVEAGYRDVGSLELALGETRVIIRPALYDIILDWLKTHNVSVKPFGWKEGE